MKKFAAAAVVGAGLVLQATAFAGAVFQPVPVTVSSRVAYGSLKTARESANNKEFIGCSVYGATPAQAAQTTYVACSASDAAGNTLYCATYGAAPQLVQAALAISAKSFVIINSDASSNCTYIFVTNNSGYT